MAFWIAIVVPLDVPNDSRRHGRVFLDNIEPRLKAKPKGHQNQSSGVP